MSNINDNEKIKAMLKFAAEKLGTTPENLKTAAQNGEISNLLKNSQNHSINAILKDPEKAKKLLSSNEAKNLFKKLGIKDEKEL